MPMSLRLNKMTDQTIRELLDQRQESLATRLASPAPAPGPARERYATAVADMSFAIGAMLYQQEGDVAEIREHLARASVFFLQALTMRGTPGPTTRRNPYEFEKALALLVCFGDAGQRGRVAEIREEQYRVPPRPEQNAFAAYLDATKQFVASGTIDEQELDGVEQRCLTDTASKDERLSLLPKVRTLRAVVQSDEAGWNAALDNIIAAHEKEALHGEYTLLPDGLICLPAMMLAQLGAERGMTCQLNSAYLPNMLLRGKRR